MNERVALLRFECKKTTTRKMIMKIKIKQQPRLLFIRFGQTLYYSPIFEDDALSPAPAKMRAVRKRAIYPLVVIAFQVLRCSAGRTNNLPK